VICLRPAEVCKKNALAGLMGRWIGARGSGIVTITGLFTRMAFSY
jgi:hypothetical protein